MTAFPDVVVATPPINLQCASQFKHFPMSFLSEDVLHIELKRYIFFVFLMNPQIAPSSKFLR